MILPRLTLAGSMLAVALLSALLVPTIHSASLGAALSSDSTRIDARAASSPHKSRLYPLSNCTSDAECLSGSCSARPLYTDANGVHIGPYFYDLSPRECDYLPLGASGCRNTTDCAEGLCKDGVCKLGVPGDRCVITYQCAGVCSEQGVCEAKAYHLGADALCHTADQCLSGSCTRSYKNVVRPSLGGGDATSQDDVSEADLRCDASALGGACAAASDCARGGCEGGTCTLLRNGTACASNAECYTGQCSRAAGTCELASASAPCAADDQCDSGVCKPGPCVEAHGGTVCAEPACAGAPLGGTCRTVADCEGGGAPGVVCNAAHKCVQA